MYRFYHIVGNWRVILIDPLDVYILKLSVQLNSTPFLNCSFTFLKWKPASQNWATTLAVRFDYFSQSVKTLQSVEWLTRDDGF